MFKKILCLLSYICVLVGSDVYSSIEPYIGPQFYYTSTRESGSSSLDGFMGGVVAGASYSKRCIYTDVRFSGAWNITSITGSTCRESSLSDYTLDWKVGYAFENNSRGSLCCLQEVIPYVGVGGQYFEDKQSPGLANLKYKYKKVFVPVGVIVKNTYGPRYRYGLQLEVKPDVYSCLDVNSTGVNIKSKYAFRAELLNEICVPVCQKAVRLHINPFYEINVFGRGSDTNSLGVPVNIPQYSHWSVGLQILASFVY
ncbi:MAG: hypothetical protein VX777_09310 [Chlamydiota bacterium]|nr:hypothetical protein [Chlamydiota bacterium]